MNKANYIVYLESKFPKGKRQEIEDKYFDKFSKYATYIGNGIYQWLGFHSTDTRELFLMGCLHSEKIKFKTQ
jgi:hypothetical protein